MGKLVCKKLNVIIILLSSIVILTTCEKDKEFPTYTDQGNIGPEGGIVKTSDGAFIDIPPGALSENRTISITNITDKYSIGNFGFKVYELLPSGLVFSDSVTIILPFDKTYIDVNSQEDNYGVNIVAYHDSTWQILNTKVDLTESQAFAKINHFSTYLTSVMSNIVWRK